MKKIILILCLFFAFNRISAQIHLEKYENLEDVTCFTINKKMFQMMANLKMDSNDVDANKYLSLLSNLDNLKMFSTTNSKIATEMRTSSNTYVKSSGMEETSKLDKTNNTKVAIKAGTKEGQIKELLMVQEIPSKKNETFLLYLTGDFNWDELMFLVKKLNLPLKEILNSK